MVHFVGTHKSKHKLAAEAFLYMYPGRIRSGSYPSVPLVEDVKVIVGPSQGGTSLSDAWRVIFETFGFPAWILLLSWGVILLVSLAVIVLYFSRLQGGNLRRTFPVV